MKKYILIFITCFICGNSFATDEISTYLDSDITLMSSALGWVNGKDNSSCTKILDQSGHGVYCSGLQPKQSNNPYITVWTTPEYSKDDVNDFVIQIQGQSNGTYSCSLMFNGNLVPNISEIVPGCSSDIAN